MPALRRASTASLDRPSPAVEYFSQSIFCSDFPSETGVTSMRSAPQLVESPAEGSSIWTTIGWLSFALPFVLYLLLRLSG
jgi:hypothetical protein